jgi:mRNA interferase MazF
MVFSQGDIIKIHGYKGKFIIVSKNAFIKATNVFHVCPVFENFPEGPLHISVVGNGSMSGTVICEQIKLIDPAGRACSIVDNVAYPAIMNISDAIQGMFEYD